MSENDYIAEYVRERYPQILMTMDFTLWKLAKMATKWAETIVDVFKGIDFSEVNKRVADIQKSAKENGLVNDTEE